MKHLLLNLTTNILISLYVLVMDTISSQAQDAPFLTLLTV